MHGNCARSSGGRPRPRDLAVRLAGAVPLALALALSSLGACAPTVETPVEAGYRRDLRDAERIAVQLRHLPMVRQAHVTLTRPVVDPLRPTQIAAGAPSRPSISSLPALPAPAATASVVLELDATREGGVDAPALTADARALVTAIAPELAPGAVTVIARQETPPPVLAKVGPFEVARRSRGPLLAALIGLLALCAGLGATLAARERSRDRAPTG